MIRMRISILLAFSLLTKKLDDKKSKKNKNDKKAKKDNAENKKPKGAKNDKPSKKSKCSKNKKNEETEVVVEKPKYLFEVGSPVGFSHIEYELIPGRPKYQIDVVCWGPIAKVFSADGEITVKTFVRDETAWVPVSLKHVLYQLEISDLVKLHSHIVNYTISTNKNKLGKRAKSENSKAFFIREEDIDSPAKFTEAYNKNPNLEKCEDEKDKRTRDLQKEIKNILWECADAPGAKNYTEIVTRLEFLSDPLHHYQANKIIDRVTAGKMVETKDFVPICPPPLTDEDMNEPAVIQKPKKKGNNKGKKGKGSDRPNKSSKKQKKDQKHNKSKKEKKEKGEGLLKIAIPGEVFYTDPTLNIYDLKTSTSEITHAYILTTVSKLMNRAQKYALNPLVIKIRKISNLPVDILADQRFSAIYACYNIPYIGRCSTIEKPLAETIKFNEAHAHFTDSVPKLKLLELMQTQRLYVEIRGVREELKKPPQPNIFGCEKNDENISKKLTTRECSQRLTSAEEPTTVTLAVACYDLSSLLKPTWDFLEKTSCRHPDAMVCQKMNSTGENFNFLDTITVNEVNLGLAFKAKSLSPLTESLLSDYGTTLKVEVYLSAPHNALLEVHTNPDIYHRLFVVINYAEIATSLLNGIMLHNQQLLGPEVLVVNYLKRNPTQTVPNGTLRRDSQRSADLSACSAAVTGFVIENGNSYAFFLEGLANGFLSDIWNQIMHAHHAIMKSFYNSDFCFERRLYSEFMKFGGIYTVSLKMPLEDIMEQQGTYVEGNIPIPCWEALKKLNLLFKCATLRAMVQYSLFPTLTQLLSLDLEYGVPFRWKQEDFETIDRSNVSLQRGENATQLLFASQLSQKNLN